MPSYVNEVCPLLPSIEKPVSAKDSRAIGQERGESFYRMCLEYAQTKWIKGLPAQALLQLNRAMSTDLSGDEEYLQQYAIPYASVKWILMDRPDKRRQFLANPRRHWQHYATRMSGPRAEIRTWRCWACFAIASRVLPDSKFPKDMQQIEEEGIIIPDESEIEDMLYLIGLVGECEIWKKVIKS